jgi:hypothetical protein
MLKNSRTGSSDFSDASIESFGFCAAAMMWIPNARPVAAISINSAFT